MTTIKLVLCAALLAVAVGAPAEAGYRRYKHKPVKSQQVVWVPLFLGVGY